MRTLLSLKKWLLPVASATVVAMLIAVMAPTTAGAASLSTTVPLLASMVCVGSLTGSGTTALPDGDVVVIGAFEQRTTTDIAPFSESSSATVYFTTGFLVDAPCTSLDSNGQGATAMSEPCGETTDWVGNYTITKGAFPVPEQPAVISAMATNVGQVPVAVGGAAAGGEPAPSGSDPFAGCTSTWEVYPYSKSTSSNMTLTGMSCPSSSEMANVGLTLECENH